ncbi:DUF5132 domain-containing protein [Spirulina subsalsa FACHB-351]|uniref:DUF5132 domain-containing protein n=1 Tax=Spirulina subsalsa FACHB-351 TaxID=234711 RepID=A0ABT3L8H0_9CYAN|nr:DUF5132 domain-containing protein [Spirulina subsalsa]MCW6037806.1 DUF5132 domain-containing protein [Spirulina subsalsa FACHB-351]
MLEQARHIYQRTSPAKAIALGIGAVILAPTVASLLKPVAKATIKTGLVLYDKTKGTIAEAGEVLGDIVAEAKAEVVAEQAQKEGQNPQLTGQASGGELS